MSFWQSHISDKFIELDYDALTENQKEESREILTAVGLEWEDLYLEFHKNTSAVLIASNYAS